MDLRFSEADEEFRTEFRAWLETSVPPEWRVPGYWAQEDTQEAFQRRRDWEASKTAAGFGGIDWPTEFGGRGGTPGQRAIHDEELAKARAPLTVNQIGLTFLAPTVMALGTPEQKAEVIGPMLRNEEIWCQGFSEPGAGSDLAAVRTKGVLDGDEYVINGQKIWTTYAKNATKMFALIRTHPGERKHQGLSMILIDLKTPGIDVRPLQQMSGAYEFGEVFFTDARVPTANVLGPPGEGFKVAMLLLSFERGASGINQYYAFRRELDDVIAFAKKSRRNGRPAIEDPGIRQRIAHCTTELEALKLHALHVLTQVEQGKELGFQSSLTKLQWSTTHQEIGLLFTDVLGPDHQLLPAAGAPPELTSEQGMFLWSRSETIWGGSSQVQRGIVAEHLLGLPRK